MAANVLNGGSGYDFKVHSDPTMNAHLNIYDNGYYEFIFNKPNEGKFGYSLKFTINYNNRSQEVASFTTYGVLDGKLFSKTYTGYLDISGISELSGNLSLDCESTTCTILGSGHTGIIPNTSFSGTFYTAPSNIYGWHESHEDYIDVAISWNNGSKSVIPYATHIANTATFKPNQDTVLTISSNNKTYASGKLYGSGNYKIKPNSKYNLYIWVSDGSNHGASGYYPKEVWTYPIINDPSLSSTTSSITISTSAEVSTNTDQFAYYRTGWSSWTTDKSYTYSNLSSNTQYTLTAKMKNTASGFESKTKSVTGWTYPVINNPSVSLRSGSEHRIIDVSVSASVSSDYDQFAYAIDGSWTSWTTSKTHAFTGLGGHTAHTITVKMRNTVSKLESSTKSKSITTWYDPMSNLQIKLSNRWFWYLEFYSTVTYAGTISKYEFAIGNEAWQNKGTTNKYSKGSTTYGTSGNLSSDTAYTCWAKLTDNHGRTIEGKIDFTTLKSTPLYLNGVAKDTFIIKPDGSKVCITPNLVTVIQPNGNTINMNKIINNDNRTSFS